MGLSYKAPNIPTYWKGEGLEIYATLWNSCTPSEILKSRQLTLVLMKRPVEAFQKFSGVLGCGFLSFLWRTKLHTCMLEH